MSARMRRAPLALLVSLGAGASAAVAADSVAILALVPSPPAAVDGIPEPPPGTPLPPPTPADRVTVEVSYTTTTASAEGVQVFPPIPSGAAAAGFVQVAPSSALPACLRLGAGSGRCAAAVALVCDADSPATTVVAELQANLVDASGATLAGDSIRPAEYTFRCAPAAAEPDLVVDVSGPATLTPGAPLGPGTQLEASNVGTGPAAGTVGTLDPPNGFMIDHVLSADTSVPPGFATYSPTWHEDVLLQGGRASNTTDLAAGASTVYPDENASIPSDTPPGDYYLCAQIDPANRVIESDETNNVDCGRVTVAAGSASEGAPARWIAAAVLVLLALFVLARRRRG